MRWKIGVLSCIACLAFGTGTSRAETNWVGVQGGIAFPAGDLSDDASTGWDIGGTGTWMLKPSWGVGVDVNYYNWSGKDEPPGIDASFASIEATGHFLYMSPREGTMKPWAKLGLGMYNTRVDVEGGGPGVDFDDSEANFGWNIGAGINLQTSPTLTYGLGLTYHAISEGDVIDNVNFVTLNLIVKFGVGGPQ